MEPIRIGQLRFPITIYERQETPDPNGSGMIESLLNPISTVADILPTGPMMFYGSIQADYEKPITHRVYCRWFPLIDSKFLITRTLNTPDGKIRKEFFRVWRVMEQEGRLRFLVFECQLERYTYLTNELFVEAASATDDSNASAIFNVALVEAADASDGFDGS